MHFHLSENGTLNTSLKAKKTRQKTMTRHPADDATDADET
jgi:hypothetical protein